MTLFATKFSFSRVIQKGGRKGRKIFTWVVCISVYFFSSISVAAERDAFYVENASHLNVVLKKSENKPTQLHQGMEVLFPLFLKTRIANDIESLMHSSAGLLVKTADSKISFIRESSEDIFFMSKDGSLLEFYSDVFTKTLKELREKYTNNLDLLYGILDFKIALSILDYEKRGYFKKGDFYIFYLMGNESSEAFILSKKTPGKAMRIGALGVDDNEFESLLLNISFTGAGEGVSGNEVKSPGYMQTHKSFVSLSCVNEVNQHAMDKCGERSLAKASLQMHVLLESLKKSHSSAEPELFKFLKASQLNWKTYMVTSCEVETYYSRDGSGFNSIWNACLVAKTNERISFLAWMIESP